MLSVKIGVMRRNGLWSRIVLAVSELLLLHHELLWLELRGEMLLLCLQRFDLLLQGILFDYTREQEYVEGGWVRMSGVYSLGLLR